LKLTTRTSHTGSHLANQQEEQLAGMRSYKTTTSKSYMSKGKITHQQTPSPNLTITSEKKKRNSSY